MARYYNKLTGKFEERDEAVSTGKRYFDSKTGTFIQRDQTADELTAFSSIAKAKGFDQYLPDQSPKVGTLGRIGSLLSSFETAPVALKTIKRYKDDPVGAVLAAPFEYIKSIASGIGSAITGKQEKQEETTSYNQVLEELGMGEMGRTKITGGIQPTGRGALGLVMDIFLDPTTYLTAGLGKGAKLGTTTLTKSGTKAAAEKATSLAGDVMTNISKNLTSDEIMKKFNAKSVNEAQELITRRIIDKAATKGTYAQKNFGDILEKYADNGGIKFGFEMFGGDSTSLISGDTLRKMAEPIKKYTDKNKILKAVSDTAGGMFWRDHGLTGDASDTFQKYEDLMKYDKAKSVQTIINKANEFGLKSPISRDSVGRALVEFEETGTKGKLYQALSANEKQSFIWVRQQLEKIKKLDQKYGNLGPEQEIAGYFPRYYKDDSTKVATIEQAYQRGLSTTLGGRQKSRVFKTVAEAEEKGLTVNYDPIEALARRWDASINAINNTKLTDELVTKYGAKLKDARKLTADLKTAEDKKHYLTGLQEKAIRKPEELIASVQRVIPLAQEKSKNLIDDISYLTEKSFATGVPDSGIHVPKLKKLKKEFDILNKQIENLQSIINPDPATLLTGTVSKPYEKQINKLQSQIAKFNTKYDEVTNGILKEQDGTLFKDISVPGYGEIRLPENIARRYNEITAQTIGDETTKSLLKNYDQVLRFSKISLTSYFPSFHGRNAISNTAQNFLDINFEAMNPKTFGKTVDMISLYNGRNWITGRTLSPEEIARIGSQTVDTATGKVKLNDLVTEAGKRGVFGGYYAADDITKTMAQRVDAGVAGAAKRLVDKPIALGGFIEDQARLMNFVGNVKSGLSFDQAAKRTKEFIFDYSNLSQFEKTYMRRGMLFYCVPDYSEIFTKEGWKKRSELEVGEDVLTYNVDTLVTEWQPVKEIAEFDFEGELSTLESKTKKFVFTDDHRFPVKVKCGKVKGKLYGGETKIIRAYELNTNHTIPTASPHSFGGNESILTPYESSLLGWIVTDGYHKWTGNSLNACIYQSPKKHADKIRKMFSLHITSERVHPDTGVIQFIITNKSLVNIKKYFKSKDDLPSIVTRLNKKSLEAMYESMMDAEGSIHISKGTQFVQKNGGVLDAFQMICMLLGKSFNIKKHASNGCHYGYIKTRTSLDVKECKRGREKYIGKVWCPKTDNSTWIMRQNGNVIFTGNTWFRKNLELQVKQMVKQPGKYATLFKALKSGTAQGEDRQNLPDWMQNKLALNIGTDEKGMKVYWANLGLPLEAFASDITDIGSFLTGKSSSLLGKTAPVIKFPLERVTGKDFFRGQPINDIYTDDSIRVMPGFMKELLQAKEITKQTASGETYTQWVANPSRLHLLRNLPTSRIQSVTGQLSSQKISAPQEALRQVTGVRPYAINEESVISDRIANERKTLEDLIIRYGVGARTKTGSFFIPKEKRKELEKLIGKEQTDLIMKGIYGK